MKLSRFIAVGLCAVLSGCGGGTVSDTPVVVQQVETPAKAMLQSVAESGELGSASMEIREALEAMKASGDAKADGLLNDLSKLETMGSGDAVKQMANEMAGKL